MDENNPCRIGYAAGFHVIFLLPFDLIAGGLGFGDMHPNGFRWRVAGGFAASCVVGIIVAVRAGSAVPKKKRD